MIPARCRTAASRTRVKRRLDVETLRTTASEVAGERAGSRTPNLEIKSLLLCQLSYAPGRNLGRSCHCGKAARTDQSAAEAAAARRLDHRLRRPPRDRPWRGPEFAHPSIAAPQNVAPAGAGCRHRRARRRGAAALREDRHAQRRAGRGTRARRRRRRATRPRRRCRGGSENCAGAPGSALEDLGVGDARVGHVRVHGDGAVEAAARRPRRRRSSRSSRRRSSPKVMLFIVPWLAAAHAERAEQHVHEALDGLDVAAAHGARAAAGRAG